MCVFLVLLCVFCRSFFVSFFFVPHFFFATTCSHFHVDLKKDDDDEALNLRFFVPSSCLCRLYISPKHPTSFPIAQNQSIAFADDDDDAKSTLVERIQPPLLRRKREGETSLFSSTRPKKNILSSSESSFLDHRSKKRSKRRYQRCRLVGKN